MQRYAYIDVFRCLAALMVVAAHTVIIDYKPPVIQSLFDAPVFELGPFNLGAPTFRGHLGVWVFYCLSGYTMAMIAAADRRNHGWDISRKDHFREFFRAFISKRLLRIYPLFLFSIIVCDFVFKPPLYANILAALMLTNMSPSLIGIMKSPMWSLVVEIQFYLVFPIIYRFLQNNRRNMLIATVATSPLLLLSHWIFWNPVSGPVIFIISNNLPGFLFFFLFGITLFEYSDDIINFGKNLMVKLIIFPMILICLFWNTSRSLISNENLIFLVMTSILLAVAMVILRPTIDSAYKNGNPIIHFISYLGRASYSIYLFHGFAVFEVNRFLTNRMDPWSSTAIKFLSGVALGCLTYAWIEKPLLRLKDRILHQKLSGLAN